MAGDSAHFREQEKLLSMAHSTKKKGASAAPEEASANIEFDEIGLRKRSVKKRDIKQELINNKAERKKRETRVEQLKIIKEERCFDIFKLVLAAIFVSIMAYIWYSQNCKTLDDLFSMGQKLSAGSRDKKAEL